MNISEVTFVDKYEWNKFAVEHYPPVGAFMQTWEWGEFQTDLGRKIGHYILMDGEEQIAKFTIVHFKLPLGLSYGYVPRGPIILNTARDPETIIAICKAIREWATKKFPKFIFLRLEPPLSSIPKELEQYGFYIPNYYIQPRYNAVVPLSGNGEDITASFHPSTRSNLRRAEKRGVNVIMKDGITPEEYASFGLAMKDTIKRNRGKNVYPHDSYFRSLLDRIPFINNLNDKSMLSLGAFYAYREGELASAHFVLFFGKTATYLYGASRTHHLHSKVDTYLHFAAMQEAKKRGFDYYDLGGIDETLWPTLTTFKRQFRGKEIHYVGNIDIPLRSMLYKIYSFIRRLRHWN